jgi:beta-lactamase class C
MVSGTASPSRIPRIFLILLALAVIGVSVWAATGNFSGLKPASENQNGAGGQPLVKDAAEVARIAEPKPNPQSNVDYQLIDSRIQHLVQMNQMVGFAIGIVENGQITFLKGYGETVAGSGDPVTHDTIFRWASVSKGVAGNMVALLAQQNEQISLQDSVAKHSATLRLPNGNEQKATIIDLLSHQLGIYAHAHDTTLEDGGDARMIRGRLATLSNICSPGQCHAYQNVAYDAASEIVERITGQGYEQAVIQQLFLPLGMRSATISRDGLVNAPNWAQPHRGGKGSKPIEVTDSYYRVPAAGGVNSSIKDLALWLRAQMGVEPKVLPPDVLKAVQTPIARTPRENRAQRKFLERVSEPYYGLGWRIYNYSGRKVVGHRGGVAGYRATIMFDPQLKSGVVALWNSGTWRPHGIEYEILDMIYGLDQRDWLQLGDTSSVVEEPAENNENGG